MTPMPQRYTLVHDNSGHDYVIPVRRLSEWDQFLRIPEDDPLAWDVPTWAKRIEGGLTFTDPQTE